MSDNILDGNRLTYVAVSEHRVLRPNYDRALKVVRHTLVVLVQVSPNI